MVRLTTIHFGRVGVYLEEFVYARHGGGFDVVMMSGGGLERLFSLAAIGKWVWLRLLGS